MEETSGSFPSNTEQPQCEFLAEYALADSIDIVVQYLNTKDLRSVALVKRTWYQATLRELAKRGLKFIIMPSRRIRLPDFNTSKPYLTLLFAPKKMELQMLDEYKSVFPNHLITIGTDTLRLDDKIICEVSKENRQGLLGLMIPQYKDIQIRIADRINYSVAKVFVQRLLPPVSQYKTTILLFTSTGTSCDILRMLKKSTMKTNQRFSLWGKEFFDKIFVATNSVIRTRAIGNTLVKSKIDRTVPRRYSHNAFAVSITGRSFNSFSTVIKYLCDQEGLYAQLQPFKKKLELKRCSFGMACGPKYVTDFFGNVFNDKQMMDTLKQVFPTIPFAGVFEHFSAPYFYGIDSTIDDPNQEFKYRDALTILIITHD